MHLQTIEIWDFKSFAGHHVITFDPCLSGVVGPNGSGKSNLVDALVWAMGTNASKQDHLGGSKEVIFAGSSARRRASFARVDLHFAKMPSELAARYSETDSLVVSRMIDETGESSYAINERRVRKKEVLSLFAGTGLGPHSFAVMNQGLITQIILSSPEEIRRFVDAAAGVKALPNEAKGSECAS